MAGASLGVLGGVGTGRRLGRGEAHVKCQESDTLRSTMKKEVCVILGAGASAVTRPTSGEAPRARRAVTENGFHVIYPPALIAVLASGRF